MTVKLVPLAFAEVVTAAQIPDANLALNGLMLVVLLFGAPRFFKSKQAEALLLEKDRTIETHEQALRAADRKAQDLAAKAEDFATRAIELQEKVAKYQGIAAGFQARYEEQSKYTAKEALGVLQTTLEHQDREQERRHMELLSVLQALQEAVGERRHSNLVEPPE